MHQAKKRKLLFDQVETALSGSRLACLFGKVLRIGIKIVQLAALHFNHRQAVFIIFYALKLVCQERRALHRLHIFLILRSKSLTCVQILNRTVINRESLLVFGKQASLIITQIREAFCLHRDGGSAGSRGIRLLLGIYGIHHSLDS